MHIKPAQIGRATLEEPLIINGARIQTSGSNGSGKLWSAPSWPLGTNTSIDIRLNCRAANANAWPLPEHWF